MVSSDVVCPKCLTYSSHCCICCNCPGLWDSPNRSHKRKRSGYLRPSIPADRRRKKEEQMKHTRYSSKKKKKHSLNVQVFHDLWEFLQVQSDSSSNQLCLLHFRAKKYIMTSPTVLPFTQFQRKNNTQIERCSSTTQTFAQNPKSQQKKQKSSLQLNMLPFTSALVQKPICFTNRLRVIWPEAAV